MLSTARFPTLALGLVLSLACTREAPAPGGDATPQAGADPQSPGVVIVTPPPGPIVGDTITIRFDAVGVAVVPATGTRVAGEAHHHLFVNAEVTPDGEPIPRGEGIHHLGDGADSLRLPLAPGSYRLIAVLAWGDHVPVAGAARDTIRIDVLSPTPD